MFVVVAERFLSNVVDEYGIHSVLTSDGGTWYPSQAYRFLNLCHHLHIPIMRKVE